MDIINAEPVSDLNPLSMNTILPCMHLPPNGTHHVSSMSSGSLIKKYPGSQLLVMLLVVLVLVLVLLLLVVVVVQLQLQLQLLTMAMYPMVRHTA